MGNQSNRQTLLWFYFRFSLVWWRMWFNYVIAIAPLYERVEQWMQIDFLNKWEDFTLNRKNYTSKLACI